MPDLELTAAERALLRAVHHEIGPCIACPADGIDDLRSGMHSGGGHGFNYEFGRTRITGRWYEWIPVKWASAGDWRPTGSPIVWRHGDLLREVTITYPRLELWIASLSAEVRVQALTWWRTYPENTRDLPRLNRLVVAQLEPTDLLGLLEVG
jgi:hypothetical protein